MRKPTKIFGVCSIIILFASFIILREVKSNSVVVTGKIFDSSGRVLEKVTVRAYRNGGLVGKGESDKEGKYEFKIDGQGSFDLVYDRTDLAPHILFQLSDKEKQTIHKVMLRMSETNAEAKSAREFAARYLDNMGKKQFY